MSQEFSSVLAGLKGAWKTATSDPATLSGGFEKPDGSYQAALVKAELTTSKSSGRPQIAWEYLIVAGEWKGETIRTWDGLDPGKPDNIKFLAQKLYRFGYDVTQMDLESDLPVVLTELAESKPVCQLRLRTNGKFQNVYMDKVLDAGGLSVDQQIGKAAEAQPSESLWEPGQLVAFVVAGKGREGVIERVLPGGKAVQVKSEGRMIQVLTDGLSLVESNETDA